MTLRYDDPGSGLTDADRAALESRLRRLDRNGDADAARAARERFGLADPDPDPLTDPATWIEQLRADDAAAQLAEMLRLGAITDEQLNAADTTPGGWG